MASSPKPPDPYATAAAQTNANMLSGQANAILGNVNEVNPYGSVAYNKLGYETVYDSQGRANYVPRYERNVQLSPDQERLLGLQTQGQYNLGQTAVEQSAKLRGLLGQNVDTTGLRTWNAGPNAPTLSTNFRQDTTPTDRPAIERALMQRFNEDQARQNTAQDVQLAARGMSPGAGGYEPIMDARSRARTDATSQAYLQSGQEARAAQEAYNAVTGLRNETAGAQFQMGGTAADRQNALRQQQLTERLALRNQPINEITALMGGSAVSMPQFQAYNAPNIGTAPIGQYIYDNYRARAQNAQAQNQGLFGIAGSLLGGIGSAGGISRFLA
jgi:hypothetical protein